MEIKVVKLWARLGVLIELTQEEWEEVKINEGISGELMQKLADSGRMHPNGNSYTPEQTYQDLGLEELPFELNHSDNWVFPNKK